EKTVSGRKTIVVGVVPRNREIVLVKREKKKKGYHNTLLDYNIYPIPEGVKNDSPAYAEMLNTAISSFCSLDKSYETWCVIPTIDVKTKFLTLPRVNSKKIYNTVYWSFKNVIAFDKENSLFDFDILGDITEGGIDKTEVMAYVTTSSVINTIKDLFEKAKIPLTGVSITAFGIQNLLRTEFIKPDCNSVCTLFVGHDWSRIDIFTQKNLYLSRDIKTGYQSFINCIVDIFPQKDRNQSELNRIADDFFTEKLVYSEINNFEDNKHFSKIAPATDRLVQQIERTFESFLSNSGKSPIKKLYLTGRLCDFNGLLDYLSKKLGVSVEIINVFTDSDFQDTPIFMLKSVSDIYLPAFGISLSDSDYTPNLTNTFKEKESVRRSKILDTTFLFSAFLVILLLSGLSFWQKYQLQDKTISVDHIKSEIKQMGPPISKNMILEKNSDILKYQKRMSATADYFLSIAAASEICRLTSENIHLVNMIIMNRKTEGEQSRSLSAHGYIFEERLLLDAALAGYRETLNSSLLFNDIIVSDKSFKVINDQDVIYFEMKMNIIKDL
ncbi:MAG: pilus assembly protein PilM, partial [Desulfobacula sp.]|nr:pilus assembly protein PilM [Desulfobacula sp.]